MKNKKRGSSLVLVTVVFFMLITFGTAIVSVTAAGYKNQINESRRAQNLYESESGLDVTYNIIAKTIEAAIVASNNAVEETLYSKNGKVETERENINRYNKGDDLVSFLYPRKGDAKNPSRVFKVNNSRIVLDRDELAKIEDEIFQKNFKVFINNEIAGFIKSGEYISVANKDHLIVEPISSVRDDKLYLKYDTNYSRFEYEGSTKPNFSVLIKGNPDDWTDEIVISVESKFYTGIKDDSDINDHLDLASKPGMQERVVSLEYKIAIPRYNSTNTTKKIQIIKRPIFDNSFAIDGNIYFKGGIDINGEVYARGDSNKALEDSNSSTSNVANNQVVFDKYNDGIIIEEESEVKVDGDIVTTKSVSLRDNTKLLMDGSMYASNLHLGKYKDFNNIGSGRNILINYSTNNVTTVDKLNLYLSNDLSIYADKSNINIQKFYGLNDVTDINNTESNISNKSSSIIINSMDGVNLNIVDEAYICGTAYINTEGKYQTGESVAIKGNYKAYTKSLEGQGINGDTNNQYKDIQFVYDNPLQLVSSYNGKSELNVFDKAQYFKDYANANKEELNDSVVVNLPANTFSVGALINGQEIKGTSSNIAQTLIDNVSKKQNEFAKKVYGFGIVDNNFYNPQNIKSVTTELNLSKLNEVTDKMQGYGYDVVFNGNSTKKVVLVGNGLSDEKVKGLKSDSRSVVYDFRLLDTDNNIRKNLSKKAGFQGLVLSAGDVEIYGAVDFNGSIIAAGSLICNNDNMEKSFTYDSKVVKQIIAYYYEDLYKEGNPEDSVIVKPNDDYTETVELDYNSSKQHNVKDYIKQGLWNIEK